MKPTREETLHNEAPRLLPDHALCEGGGASPPPPSKLTWATRTLCWRRVRRSLAAPPCCHHDARLKSWAAERSQLSVALVPLWSEAQQIGRGNGPHG